MEAKSEIPSLTSLAEFKEKIAGDTPVLIDFWATWCGPCRVISPILEKLAEKVEGVEFYKVDVDAQPEISEEVKIRAMPTFVLFKKGERVGDLVGAIPAKLEALVKTASTLATPVAKSGVEGTGADEKPNTAPTGVPADPKPARAA